MAPRRQHHPCHHDHPHRPQQQQVRYVPIVVIIQALAPVIGPYMSRAITTIHVQDATARSTAAPRRPRGAIAVRIRGWSADVRLVAWDEHPLVG